MWSTCHPACKALPQAPHRLLCCSQGWVLSKDYLNTSIADVRISQSKSKAYDFRFLAGGVAAPVALRLGVAATFASAFEATGADLAFALALLSGLGFAAAFTFGLALAPADFSPLGTNDLAKAQIKNKQTQRIKWSKDSGQQAEGVHLFALCWSQQIKWIRRHGNTTAIWKDRTWTDSPLWELPQP